MRQVLIRRGSVEVVDVPCPLVEPGNVLVEVAYSVISTGTETSALQSARSNSIGDAITNGQKIRQLADHLRAKGFRGTLAKVRSTLDGFSQLGYSCAGTVVAVGEGISDLAPGDRVACAGAGFANHAEMVVVPRNLVAPVPPDCSTEHAASVTLGAIAMQGVRRAQVSLGEIVAVIGLGLIGQITAQLLRAAGCRVIGIDLDRSRVALAIELGAQHACCPGDADVQAEIQALTGGRGVDVSIVTAATPSDEVMQQAMEITRKKGRVVIVGDVGLGLRRSPFYQKEIDLLISCSYGPGRYDDEYEVRGTDYPYAYVRWTENRNMAEYLRLIAAGQIALAPLLSRIWPVEQAPEAYAALRAEKDRPLGVLLRYAPQTDKPKTKVAARVRAAGRSGRIRLALLGAGAFAKSVHLPNLVQLSDRFEIRAIGSASGPNAMNVATRYGAAYGTTSYADILSDPDVDAVLIATRHHLHAGQIAEALRAGKHVFCEKPLALTEDELTMLREAVESAAGAPVLAVGFNRRFSEPAARLKKLIGKRHGPVVALYRVNAGYLPPEHWTHGIEGGGRIRGEACHMFDMFDFLVDSAPVSVNTDSRPIAQASQQNRDDVAATVRYADGSICTLIYTSCGNSRLAKEYLEVHVDGRSAVLDDYRSVTCYSKQRDVWTSRLADKGHRQALEAFARAVQDGGSWPIPFQSLLWTTSLTLAAAQSTEAGVVGEDWRSSDRGVSEISLT